MPVPQRKGLLDYLIGGKENSLGGCPGGRERGGEGGGIGQDLECADERKKEKDRGLAGKSHLLQGGETPVFLGRLFSLEGKGAHLICCRRKKKKCLPHG